jgi:hypothetical protein
MRGVSDCCTPKGYRQINEWCPNSNLFEDKMSAEAWSASRGLEGRILSLEEASVLATKEWLPLLPRRALMRSSSQPSSLGSRNLLVHCAREF